MPECPEPLEGFSINCMWSIECFIVAELRLLNPKEWERILDFGVGEFGSKTKVFPPETMHKPLAKRLMDEMETSANAIGDVVAEASPAVWHV